MPPARDRSVSACGPLPPPSAAPVPDVLPHALTFFLQQRERSAVLRALKRLNPDRRAALLRALKIDPKETAR